MLNNRCSLVRKCLANHFGSIGALNHGAVRLWIGTVYHRYAITNNVTLQSNWTSLMTVIYRFDANKVVNLLNWFKNNPINFIYFIYHRTVFNLSLYIIVQDIYFDNWFHREIFFKVLYMNFLNQKPSGHCRASKSRKLCLIPI